MEFGTFVIDNGLLWAILWVFGWAAVEYFEKQQVNDKRLRIFGIMHEERMRAAEKGLPVPDMTVYERENR